METPKNTSTEDLIRRLNKATEFENFLNNGLPELPPFYEYIAQLCRDMGEMREHVIKRAAIDRTYGHQLFNGTRKPSRDKVIQLAFGLGLDVEQTQKLLKVAQKSMLYPKIKRDAAITYCIMHQAQVAETQKLLASLNLELLGD